MDLSQLDALARASENRLQELEGRIAALPMVSPAHRGLYALASRCASRNRRLQQAIHIVRCLNISEGDEALDFSPESILSEALNVLEGSTSIHSSNTLATARLEAVKKALGPCWY